MKCNWKYAVTTFLGVSLASNLMPLAKSANQLGIVSVGTMGSATEISGETRVITSELIETGRQRYASGQFSGAVEAWRSAIDAAIAQDAKIAQMVALSYLSLAYQALSQWDLAETAIEQSVELLENKKLLGSSEQNADKDPHPMLQAQVLNTQASLVYHLGQAELALDLWQQSEALYQQAEDTPGVLGSQLNQAQALQSLGYYRRSRQQLEDIAQQLRTLPDSALKANGLRTLGMALRVLGDLEGSRAALFESANIAVDINATNELSVTYLSLGKAATDWGDAEAAIAMFEQARQAARNPTDILQADLERLRFYVNSGDIEQSTSAASDIASQLEKLPPSRIAVYATVNLTASLAREELLGRSLPITQQNQLLAKAVSSARGLNDPQAEAHALNQWGALYTLTEQWSEALTLTEQSLTIARSIQADDIASQSAWQLGRILKQQNNTSEAITAYSEAVDSLQSLRSDLVAIDPAVQFSFRENTEPIYREFVSLLLETGSSHNKSSRSKRAAQPSQKNLAQARQVIEALQLAELDNFFREACIDVSSQQIDQVDTQATIVYPIILPDRLAVISSSPGRPLTYHATTVSAETVEDTLRELLSAIHPAADNARRLALSQQVYDWLIRPTEERQITTKTKTMVFVLDGLLRSVPMAALYDGDQYLIEKYAVALSPGLQLMSAQSLDEIDASAIAGGISEARNGLSALPAVKTELADIGELISTNTLLNEAFTSKALASNVKNSTASIVHLATHGQFSSRLEDTFLSTWEGRLNVNELSEILQSRGQLAPIELLVLSACDTASGDDRAVLGLAGLAVKSGARSTVATLWPVKDQAAAKLMQALYEGISTLEVSKAEALRQAQLTLLADPSYSDPFFWSAYALVGNWR